MPVDIDLLKTKLPLKYFPERCLKALTEVVFTTDYKNHDVIFRVGDDDDLAAFLIRGSINLESLDGRVTTIGLDQKVSRYALANLKPRLYTARAAQKNTAVLWVKSTVLDKYLTEHSQQHAMGVEEGFRHRPKCHSA
jgi:CRP-like cAMP-binding protein